MHADTDTHIDINTNIHKKKHTQTHTDTHRHIQTHIDTDTHRHRCTHTHTNTLTQTLTHTCMSPTTIHNVGCCDMTLVPPSKITMQNQSGMQMWK